MAQLRPKDITSALGISPATLRLWSNNFAPVLSPAAQKTTTEQGTAAQRRYNADDLKRFTRAKQLLSEGKTYEQVLDVLKSEDVSETLFIPSPNGKTAQSEPQDLGAVLATVEEHPVMLAFRQAIEAKDQTIAAKDETIRVLEQRVAEFNALAEQPAPELLKPQFRWRWLNWLLKP